MCSKQDSTLRDFCNKEMTSSMRASELGVLILNL